MLGFSELRKPDLCKIAETVLERQNARLMG